MASYSEAPGYGQPAGYPQPAYGPQTQQPPTYYNLASLVDRGIAIIIDGIILGIIIYALLFASLGTALMFRGAGFLFAAQLWIGLTLVSFIYFVALEGTRGQTIGKMIMNIKVIKTDGTPCDLSAAIIRNILRIIDYLPVLYILGIILIATSDLKQRLGDRVANTIVIKLQK